MSERENLEAAGIGEDRFVPANETVQTTELTDHVETGSQKQVERVAKDDLGTDFAQVARCHRLD